MIKFQREEDRELSHCLSEALRQLLIVKEHEQIFQKETQMTNTGEKTFI